jgi:hypothetical protein
MKDAPRAEKATAPLAAICCTTGKQQPFAQTVPDGPTPLWPRRKIVL